MRNLTLKYSVPESWFTCYPSISHWDVDGFSVKNWKASVKRGFDKSRNEGIGVYIYLPFCETACTFCACHKYVPDGHEVEAPYINALLKEWSLYCDIFGHRPMVKELHLRGGTPTFFSPENLTRLISGILIRCTVAPEAEFSFEGHPKNTTRKHLQGLFNLGFRKVSFGVQDYNTAVQLAINRLQSFEAVQEITQIAREIGYTTIGHDLIYGLPFQTVEDIKNTLVYTNEIGPDFVAFYGYDHVPWQKRSRYRGFSKKNLPSSEGKWSQYVVGTEWLEDMGYAFMGMDYYAKNQDCHNGVNQGGYYRNFTGHTLLSDQFTLGLGASSMGNSIYALAKNVESVEKYQRLLAADRLPVHSGYLFNKEDRIIRKHITNLMQDFETSWSIEEKRVVDFLDITERLEEMEAAGLVTIGTNAVEITQKGRPFAGNISKAFDIKQKQRKIPNRFSRTTFRKPVYQT